eukprot:TRINITY_DN1537_c1_g1_i2.p1 TRINITY_DN1537_c1_g1~~TRINITY_DN1537_c1_g1_i2.p1  ORF type:complete len:192 (+),score=31.53 TRINITY_DN1537_c1_g1_i2:105-680(+)
MSGEQSTLVGFPISFSVPLASVICLGRAIVVLSLMEADEAQMVFGVTLSPFLQSALGVISLIGFAVSVLANFGVAFRLETYVSSFAQFMAFSLILDVVLGLVMPLTNDLCGAMASDYVLRNGRVFVCSFINSAFAFWMSAALAVEGFIVSKVWAFAETLRKGEQAELLRYFEEGRSRGENLFGDGKAGQEA